MFLYLLGKAFFCIIKIDQGGALQKDIGRMYIVHQANKMSSIVVFS
jgi:hypothetical protein